MKKGKVLGKGQIAVGIMVIALGAAVWLNTKYLPSSSKYLGEASYVSNTSSSNEAVETAAKVETSDYFATAKKEREDARNEACETIEETLKNTKVSDEDKASALAKIEEIGSRMENEANVEALLKAKGFEKTLVIISDSGVSVVVSSKGLTSAQTLQIQDVVTAETGVALANIKIIPVA